MTYIIEVLIRDVWLPMQSTRGMSREGACNLIMKLRRKSDGTISFDKSKFRICKLDIVDLEELE